MGKVYRTGNYPPHYGYTDPDEDPEVETGKADTYDGFRDQLDELHESKWAELYELMYQTKCSNLVAFFEDLDLVSDDG